MGIDREKVLTEVFERYGNIVSSSVPAGICRAVNKGKIKTGDEISLTPASAGLSAAVVKLNY